MHVIHMPAGLGWVEVITGPMFSGKSEELIRRINLARYAKLDVLVFKPKKDTRGGNANKDYIVSRTGTRFKAVTVNSAEDVFWESNRSDAQIIAIDEAQFLYDDRNHDTAQNLVKVVDILANSGRRVIVAGLDQDASGTGFGPVPYLMAIADEVTKLFAHCTVCGAPANKTACLADRGSSMFLVGSDMYEARCRLHFRT